MKTPAFFLISLLAIVFTACGNDDTKAAPATDAFIRGADMSFLPEIEASGTVYYNSGKAQDALLTLKEAGVNTIRIRLWKDPANGHSGMAEVKAFAQRVRAMGMKVWLTVHYSDTWADPANQVKPGQWEGLSFEALKAAAKNYTADIVAQIKPDIIQIGNETNTGFIYPEGNLVNNEAGFLQLVAAISATIREQSPGTKIMLHYAGIEGADWFFNKVKGIDYDFIGLSFYPVWHGKDLTALQGAVASLGQAHGKEVVVAETSYPFTLGYNDWTNNVVGGNDQIIPAYPASAPGQENYLLALRTAVKAGNGKGFCYWGGEWLAFKGSEAVNGSSYENQALWDFSNNALPALGAFKKDN